MQFSTDFVILISASMSLGSSGTSFHGWISPEPQMEKKTMAAM